MNKAEQALYDLGQKETKAHLMSQIPVVCRSFYLWTWVEALNAVGVDPSLELRNLKKVFYLPTIRAQTSVWSPPKTTTPTQSTPIENPPLKSNTIALPTFTVATEISSLEKDPTSTEAAPLASQPIVEG